MSDIVLATANARYSHTSFALRYLLANLGDLSDSAVLLEFTLEERPSDMVEKILGADPRIVGFSVYLWNVELLARVVSHLKRVRPDIILILGGPEVSFPEDLPRIVDESDYVITGEGEVVFRELCNRILDGNPPSEKVIAGGMVSLGDVKTPYHLYSDSDIANRVIYVEATRGCPYGCEFCLAANDKKVRRFSLDGFREQLDELFERGARRFKFVDRTLHLGVAKDLLGFFLERQEEGLFVHFELVPDRVNDEILGLLAKFCPGGLQLEVGLQSLNPDVTERISRRQDPLRAMANLKRLLEETDAHVHTDLVAGLPGETLESFADGFDRLYNLGPDEIQVGILKRLRGAPIHRHTEPWEMVYSAMPPYEILQNKLIDFESMQRIKRFARFFDMVSNSGNFKEASRMVLDVFPLHKGARGISSNSPFDSFMHFSDWLYTKTGRTGAIALNRLATLILEYLAEERGLPTEEVAHVLYTDFTSLGRKSMPAEVMEHIHRSKVEDPAIGLATADNRLSSKNAPPRQRRHVKGTNR